MKKSLIIITLFCLSLSFSFYSCKKGDADPFFSLRSRTSRLVGEWKMIGYHLDINYYNNGESYDVKMFYNNETNIMDFSDFVNPMISYKYFLNYEFTKDGKFVKTETIGNNTKEYNGEWIWGEKDEERDIKSKEEIILTFSDNIEKDTIRLYKLKNDEIAFDLDEIEYDGDTKIESSGKTFFNKE